jgi:hypothetical protein
MLQIDFIERGSADCPIVRIAGIDPAACTLLGETLGAMTRGSVARVAIHELPGIASTNGCVLFACVGSRERGTVRQPNCASFDWILTRAGWENVCGLIEPFFARGDCGYQWLEYLGDAKILLTSTGRW